MVFERIRQALRTNDLLGRFAGYEFFLLCLGAGPRIASAIASRFLRGISELPVLYKRHSISVTVSMRVGCTQTKALSTLSYLVNRADAALRRAKLAGNNRTVTVLANT